MNLILIIILTVIIISILMLVYMYNTLIDKKNMVDNAFAGTDTILKKRYDLIPNLVSAVQQYMRYEKDTLNEITELRTEVMSGKLSDDEKVALNNKLDNAVNGMMLAVENYPELKANENFMQLQRTLTEVEEQLSAARRAFNAAVTDFNNAIEMFPTNIFAGLMNYKQKKLFEIVSEPERKNVDVSRLFNKK